ncbi:alpha-L-fucosidase [Hufsiella ginkgonis]|uniref:alpha-L-fucosidase n=1 Tax=Hufsiella ginkgonis TaxID=2695274 RepID=A0A7K1XVZ8_9SPHI|nr:alpha-L-fucosidase [Hufsiella ginkgonis]MXV14988.1 alpha-L-fucosidase [Hufsiella ginkgonis]
MRPRKTTFLLAFLLLTCSIVNAQDKGDEDKTMSNSAGKARDQEEIDEAMNGWWKASMQTHDQRIAWWREARFGMFIHWGIYSLPGGEWKGRKVSGYAEHLMRKEKITRAEYLELAHQFNPVKFNADEWVRAARNAGMKYLVITAKHHDGFAMYASGVSDFNVLQQTPWKHDPMADLSAACKKYGVKFGFYYSHAFDWEHPDAPGNDWEYKNPGGDLNLFGGRDWYDVHPELLPKAVKYVNEKAIPQIRELLTKYHPDIIWFDTPQKLPLSENIRILKAIRQTDQHVVVNGRLARSANAMLGDYQNTADRPAEFFPAEGDWEAIPTTNESYGYSKFDDSHKPAGFFIRLLAKSASRGGNLLMNLGPMGDGAYDPKDLRILNGIGSWMAKNSESIYATTRSPLALQSWGVVTAKPGKLYLHVFNWPAHGKLVVGGLSSGVKNAYLLADAKKKSLACKLLPHDVNIMLPLKAPDTINTVIVLETTGPPAADQTRLLDAGQPNRLLAFDADLGGKGLTYGDGKMAKYFVENWKSTDQSISWNFRLNEAARFRIVIKYAATPETGGKYQLRFDDVTKESSTSPSAAGEKTVSTGLGEITLQPGKHRLRILPASIAKTELMKLFEIQLIPVK